ncbi:hypothetical protein [Actinomadura rupiterrae]|uniref:hypothetical protein n=1 Tax=Actinomadura rupiterrae TaxID=559627 RepID=UPI0020A39A46|nr:hypothetical protein [Actinomadura rupiterrae]MCP2338944.1 hypothetical protein [Actinomadura rupiterrae]
MTRRLNSTTARAGLGTAAAAAWASLVLGGGPALAAPSADPTPADLAAAQKVAAGQATHDRLASFFVHLDQRGAGKLITKSADAAAAKAKAPQITGTARPVYTLNAAFVRGTAGAPVATFAYLAVPARSASGQQASVWLTKGAHGWRVLSITSGTEETTYTSSGTGTVFTEPQIHAWYRLDKGKVTGLDKEALTSVGKSGVSVAAYQKLVHTRYGDKLPGSAYVREGKLGGFQPSTGVPPAHRDNGSVLAFTALGGCGLVLAAGSALVLRRRTRRS